MSPEYLIPQEEKKFEVGVSRHAPKVEKSGEIVDVSTQEVDEESAKQEIEHRTRFVLDNLEQAPTGTVLAFEPSNVKRSEQTRGLFIDKLKELLGERDDIKIVEIGENREAANKTLDRIRNEPEKKYIIADLRGTWLIGFKNDESFIPTFMAWKNKLKGDENLLGKVWAAHKDEITSVAEELGTKGIDISAGEIDPKKFQSTPEEQVLRFVKWIQAIKKIGTSYFPNRSLILEGISHNLRSDYTTLALLGEDISVESINRVLGGEFRKPFERSSIIFEENGNVKIRYREIEKSYSLEEFEEVVKSIREKLNARKNEWAESNF